MVKKLHNNLNYVIVEFELDDNDNRVLQFLSFENDGIISLLERELRINIQNLGFKFKIQGDLSQCKLACKIIKDIARYIQQQLQMDLKQRRLELTHLQDFVKQNLSENNRTIGANKIENGQIIVSTDNSSKLQIYTLKKVIYLEKPNQILYYNSIMKRDMIFGVGPAGTGKTFVAIACAVSLLLRKQIKKIVLTRPVVEAGENLGFLPGAVKEKIDPYLQPLYDALIDTLGVEKVNKFLAKKIIEIAPLAYMRGRTLGNSCVILDEAQNTTNMQMKMFLTRLGKGSKMIINGDITQSDLSKSGLQDALKILQHIKQIAIIKFSIEDVVRHGLVRKIIDAYDKNGE